MNAQLTTSVQVGNTFDGLPHIKLVSGDDSNLVFRHEVKNPGTDNEYVEIKVDVYYK